MTDSLEKYIFAIDLGTGGPKVALVSTRGEIVAHAMEETPLILLPGGGVEQDPRGWWNAIVRASRRVHEAARISPDRIVAVSVASQWSSTVAVDEAGRPLMNAILWMDARGARYCQELTDGLVRFAGCSVSKLWRWVRLTGGRPTSTGADSLAHILFIQHERPDVYRRTHKFLEPMDYLGHRLCGRFAASYGGIFTLWATDARDMARVVYDDTLLRRCGLDRAKHADLVAPLTVLGPVTPEAAEELGLGPHTQVVVGTGDNQSAIVGSGAVLDGQGHCYVGTTSWISCHVPFRKVDVISQITTMPAAIPGRHIVLAQQGTGGECLRFLRDSILCRDDGLTPPVDGDALARLNALAGTVPPGSEGLIFTPFLTGALTPQDDRYTRSAFVNQSLATTRAHYARAVMEGVAYNLRWLLACVDKFTRRPFPALHCIGGAAQSDLWCQILADVLGRPIRQMDEPRQANVRGAAFLAAMALGLRRLEEIPSLVPVRATFEPEPANRALYDALYREFVAFYRRNRRMYARLNAARYSQPSHKGM